MGFMLTYVLPSSNLRTPGIDVVKVEEIECQIFGIPDTTQPFCFSQDGTATFTATGAISPAASQPLAVINPTAAPQSITAQVGLIYNTVTNPLAVNAPATASPVGMLFSGNLDNLHLCPSLGQSYTQVELTLYVTEYSVSTGLWNLRGILSTVQDQTFEYLDHVEDVVIMPYGFYGLFSRSWRLKLPHPVYLKPGEGLIASWANNGAPGFNLMVPYIRSRVSVCS